MGNCGAWIGPARQACQRRPGRASSWRVWWNQVAENLDSTISGWRGNLAPAGIDATRARSGSGPNGQCALTTDNGSYVTLCCDAVTGGSQSNEPVQSAHGPSHQAASPRERASSQSQSGQRIGNGRNPTGWAKRDRIPPG
jgi:hypothetical protein